MNKNHKYGEKKDSRLQATVPTCLCIEPLV